MSSYGFASALPRVTNSLGKNVMATSNVTSGIAKAVGTAGKAAFSASSLIPWVGLATSVADAISSFSQGDDGAWYSADYDTRSKMAAQQQRTNNQARSAAQVALSILISILTL